METNGRATGLRRALAVDAVASGVTGVAMSAGAAALAPVLGLPEPLVQGAGLVMLPFAAVVGYLATRRSPPAGAVRAVIGLNAAWVAASVALLVSGWVAPTGWGYAFVLGQAAAVAAFAEMEWTGLRAGADAPGLPRVQRA